MSKKDQNILLQKSELGKIKKGFHDLPSDTHTYGKAPQKDQYGAREGIEFYQHSRIGMARAQCFQDQITRKELRGYE